MQEEDHLEPARSVTAEIAAFTVIVVFGCALFLGFGGASLLPVQNISWIRGGDPSQHLLGWLFYRQTDLLQWPIGANLDFGELTAGSVVFSDSLPLFAAFFRLMDPLLPEIFQYFGIWILGCFLLQGVFGFWLLRLLSVPVTAATAGACLLLASPYMIMRLSGHEALMGHWLLLAALCLYLRPRMSWLAWGALLLVAVGVHAYLAAMVGGIWTARLWLEHRNPVATALRAAMTLVACGFLAWALGYFMIAGDGVQGDGFGIYRTTLTSWIDPAGMWGLVLPDLPKGPGTGTYEGFAYLGLGALLALLLAAAALLMSYCRAAPVSRSKTHAPIAPLVTMSVAYVIFAVSDRISAFGVMLLDVSLLEHLPLASTFRASGRFIWLPSYVLVAFAIREVALRMPKRMAMPALAVLAIVQVGDMTHAMRYFRENFATPVERQFTAPFWDEAGAHYKRIAAWPIDPHSGPVIEASFVAARHGMSIDQAYLARWIGGAFTQTRAATRSQLANGTLRADTLYLLHDAVAAEATAKRISDLNLDAFFASVDGVWVIAPAWKGCGVDCGADPKTSPSTVPHALPADSVIILSEGGNFDDFARWGWSWGEASGRWTDGTFSTVSVALEGSTSQPISIIIEAKPYLSGSTTAQLVQIFANGVLSHTEVLTKDEVTTLAFDIPQAIIDAERRLDIELRMPNATTPHSLGLGDDTRELGLYISSISIRSDGT